MLPVKKEALTRMFSREAIETCRVGTLPRIGNTPGSI